MAHLADLVKTVEVLLELRFKYGQLRVSSLIQTAIAKVQLLVFVVLQVFCGSLLEADHILGKGLASMTEMATVEVTSAFVEVWTGQADAVEKCHDSLPIIAKLSIDEI